MTDKWEIRLSGTGGQGIIRAAVLLGQAALYDGVNAVQSQVYGPESRGGATKGEVVIAPDKIYYPKVVIPNVVLCMSPLAYEKYGQDILEGGWLFVDAEIKVGAVPAGVKLYHLPMVEAARDQLHNEMSANVVALGAMLAATKVVSEESLKQTIKDGFKAKVQEINLKALALGQSLIK